MAWDGITCVTKDNSYYFVERYITTLVLNRYEKNTIYKQYEHKQYK